MADPTLLCRFSAPSSARVGLKVLEWTETGVLFLRMLSKCLMLLSAPQLLSVCCHPFVDLGGCDEQTRSLVTYNSLSDPQIMQSIPCMGFLPPREDELGLEVP